MKNILFLLFPILSACIADPPIKTSEPPGGEEARGAEPVLVLDPQNNTVLSYINSYALIIGQSNYINGWSTLSTVPGEVEEVATVLTEQGFVVEKHLNLNAVDLEKSYKGFIKNYGYKSKNRLLFFFSGHGYSRFKGKKGYIVPVDAPNPNIKGQEEAFLKTAISMTQINAWAKEIEAQHALFLFDSCFSGTVFQNKSGSTAPPYITEAISNPARQFITAGNADEMVPSESVFTPAFVNALRYKLGDLNKDGYVTGVELGFYLANEVPRHAPQQHPQHGKIQGYDFSLGDFVFVLDQKTTRPFVPPPLSTFSPPVITSLPPPESKLPVPITPYQKSSDKDGDGVGDRDDKCPNNSLLELRKGVYKTGRQQGCPLDKDQDKVPDYRDNCPYNQPDELVQGINAQGCPVDTDHDGVANYRDKCARNRKNEIRAGVDSQGCPLDSDQDKVADYQDDCPNTRSHELSDGIDARGCPVDTDHDGVANYKDQCIRNSRHEISKGVDSKG
ncbi:MAG: caspase family protein, partial [Thiomargarita sp.]|nr:caspase family protein [Thiomargarita sp.]